MDQIQEVGRGGATHC